MLKNHKLTYLNQQIHLAACELVLEFYVNAYRSPDDESTFVTDLES